MGLAAWLLTALLPLHAAALPQVDGVAQAHGAHRLKDGQALTAWVEVKERGRVTLDGSIRLDVHGQAGRFRARDGRVWAWDGAHAWTNARGPDRTTTLARLRLLQALAVTPWNLAGAKEAGELPLAGVASLAWSQSFTTDAAARRWSLAYVDGGSGLLRAVAFDQGPPSPDEHGPVTAKVAVFSKVQKVDGVRLHSAWQVFAWSQEEDLHGPLLESVSLRGWTVLDALQVDFAAPPDATPITPG